MSGGAVIQELDLVGSSKMDSFRTRRHFCSSCARRFASASPASRLLAKPDSATNRRSCAVEPGALNMYRQTVLPDPYLRLNTGISSPPLPLVGVEVQRPPEGRSCAPRPGTRAWL